MAIKQYWIDRCEKELRQQILQELQYYHRLRQAWGLGPLKLRRSKGGLLDIWVEYWDIEDNRFRQAFLGSGKWRSAWASALQCVKHVKSFLQNSN